MDLLLELANELGLKKAISDYFEESLIKLKIRQCCTLHYEQKNQQLYM
jgi:hypothetical protein